MPLRLRRPELARRIAERLPSLNQHALVPAVLALLTMTLLGAGSAGATTVSRRDVYFAAGYEHQVDGRTCTAAATAMMMNFIAGRDLNLGQLFILRYEQPRDALNDAVQRGSDPLGWSRAATYFSRRTPHPTTYAWEAYDSEVVALLRAARQIALTGKAVGLLIDHGTHAVVMTGYTATRSPLHGQFAVLSITYSDPNGVHHQAVAAASSPLDRYYQTDATPTYDRLWYGKFIIVAPQY